MFDIGFFELLIIAIVGLFVIGPERLPATIRVCGLWIGRIKRSITETRREIEQQLGADEIRRELQNEQVLKNLEKMKDTRAELEAKIRNLGTGIYQGQEAEAKSDDTELEDHSLHDPNNVPPSPIKTPDTDSDAVAASDDSPPSKQQ